ncbi:muscle M-line assembly protein unc-89-like [Daktulosphaira vitifoliae]|uniref:muscle M-line assembly protein unc-89-like n=1 Tax=Daktulosphaira vitifoliae TaxID=58002 RepID=UPI0021AA9A42|nr:muscle M-line assembly protein unc-89-like [Daktulosphaira vitifoliae]
MSKEMVECTSGSSPATTAESEEDDLDSMPSVDPETFKWSTSQELSLLLNMIQLKPAGINKHLSMCLIREKLSKELKLNIPSQCIWKYLWSRWNMDAADDIEKTNFSTALEDFDLPEDEYSQLLVEEGEKLRKQIDEEESLITKQELASIANKKEEIKKKKILRGSGKTRSKSDSISSVDSKDGIVENNTGTLDTLIVKSEDLEFEEITTSTRRSLRTNEKPEEKEKQEKEEPDEQDASNKKRLLRVSTKVEIPKTKEPKILCKRPINPSKEVDLEETLPSNRGRKRKNRNVSESSISSDNSKHPKINKNNSYDVNASDSSSRSVTPENLKSKMSTRSITPDTSNRKSNLRSSDRDFKSKITLDKSTSKNHNVDHLQELKTENIKIERGEKQSNVDSKPKRSIHKHSEVNKVKAKSKPRLSSDAIVAQQAEVQTSLGRRSCINKN